VRGLFKECQGKGTYSRVYLEIARSIRLNELDYTLALLEVVQRTAGHLPIGSSRNLLSGTPPA